MFNVRPYVLISIWAKKPAQRSAGTRGAHPIRYRSAFQLFVLLPIPGGVSMAPCGIARMSVPTHVRTYFPFLFFTVFQFWFLRRRMKARPSSNDIGHPTAAGECEEGGGAQVNTYAGRGRQRSRSPNSSRRAAGAAAAHSTASASAQASASASAPAGAPAATGPPVGQTRQAQI